MNSNYLKLCYILIVIFSAMKCRSEDINIYSTLGFSQTVTEKIAGQINRSEDDPILFTMYVIKEKIKTLDLSGVNFHDIYVDSLKARLELEPFFGDGVEFLVQTHDGDWYRVFLEVDVENRLGVEKRMQISKLVGVYEGELFVAASDFGISKNDHLFSLLSDLK